MEAKDVALIIFGVLYVVGFFLCWCCLCPPGSDMKHGREKDGGEDGEDEKDAIVRTTKKREKENGFMKTKEES